MATPISNVSMRAAPRVTHGPDAGATSVSGYDSPYLPSPSAQAETPEADFIENQIQYSNPDECAARIWSKVGTDYE
jgi:hypothetical protein